MKYIKNYEGQYSITEEGKVFSHKSNIFLTLMDNRNGYLFVNLYKNGKLFSRYIHRLVAFAFLENPNNHKYVDHIDRDKSNNRVENLRFVSASENTRNTAGKPRYSVERKNFITYSPEFIQKIKDEYKNGSRVFQISKKYNIPRQSVSRFVKETK